MTSLTSRISALATRIADEFNAVRGEIGGGGLPPTVPSFNVFGGDQNLYTPDGYTTSASTAAMTANTIFFFPITAALVATGITFEVTTSVASSNARVGLYGSDSNGFPAALLYGSGNIATTSTGVKTFSFGADAVLNGLYWLALFTSHTPTLRAMSWNSTIRPPFPQTVTNVGATMYHFRQALTFGALPNPAAITTNGSGGTPPGIFLRGKIQKTI